MDAVIVVIATLVVLVMAAWAFKLFRYVHSGEWQIDQRLKSL
jgi:hypothetical protein